MQARSRDVTSSTLRLEQVVNQLEASLRGFVISGDERFLGSWRSAKGRVPDTTRQVTEGLAGQGEQEHLALELATLVRAYVNEYGIPLIKIFRFDPSAARAPVATREGLYEVTTIRTQLEQLLSGEAALASTDAASAKSRSTQAVEIGIAALCGTAVPTHPVRAIRRAGNRHPGPVGRDRRQPRCGGRPLDPHAGGRRGRDPSADRRLQRHGALARAGETRARGPERGAETERADEVPARQHRLARAPKPAHEHPRLHEPAPQPRGRPCAGPALPRDHPAAGKPAHLADRPLPRQRECR